jgi:hypothetical protein
MAVYTIGHRQAADKTSYFLLGKEEALIEIYGDKAVTIGFNSETGVLTGKVKIFQIDSSGFTGETKKIGKLTKAKQYLIITRKKGKKAPMKSKGQFY